MWYTCNTNILSFKASTTIIKASTELSIHRRWRRKPPRFTIGEKYLFESGTFICWHFYEGRKSKDNETGYLCSFDLWPTVYYVQQNPNSKLVMNYFGLGSIQTKYILEYSFTTTVCLPVKHEIIKIAFRSFIPKIYKSWQTRLAILWWR